MLEQIDDVLRKWAQALTARWFYPVSHPTVQNAESELLAALNGAFSRGGSFWIATLADRLLFRNQPLPSGESSGRPIQKLLQRSRVDRITFEPGIDSSELTVFLNGMVACARGQGLLRDTRHVRLEYALRDEEREKILQQSPGLVREIHRILGQGEGIDYGQLAEVVSGVLAIVGSRPQAILPLAQIKDHDEYTYAHTVNVAILSAATGHALGCGSSSVHDLVVSGVLHDVGKQRVPVELLRKATRLTPEEAAILRRHPEDGARMLMNIRGIPDVAIVVAYEHHQRARGGGYPAPVPGWEPHLASRIVQLADVFDALRTHRPYRAAVPLPVILQILRKDEDSFTDPELMRLFLSEVALGGKEAEDFASAVSGKYSAAAVVERL